MVTSMSFMLPTTINAVQPQASAVSSRPVPAVNGKYVLERRLGGGGMAEVFLGRMVGAEGFSRPVAIKRVLDGFSGNPQFASMFVAEAQLTSRLQHPNIVSVIDFDSDAEGRWFLVMELVDGTDLDGLLATGPLPFSLVIHVAMEILRGLDYAHELPIHGDGVRGLVHRDISPHNVLLSWEGAVKVSDFGIAKARAASNASASILIKGKPAYMSPEQVNGRPLDGRSDLFSVGVMMFEMLCLQPLFAGTTTEETLGRVLFAPIPDPRALRPEIPEDLSRVVASLLERERDQRMRSADAGVAMLAACADCPKTGREELSATLSQRFAGRAPIRARNISHLSHSEPTLVARSAAFPRRVRPTATATSDLAAMPRRERRWVWAVLAGLVVTGGTVGVVVANARATQPIATIQPATDGAVIPTPAGPTSWVTAPRPPDPSAELMRATDVSGRKATTPSPSAFTSAPAPPAPKATPLPRALEHTPRPHAPSGSPQGSATRSDGIREIHL